MLILTRSIVELKTFPHEGHCKWQIENKVWDFKFKAEFILEPAKGFKDKYKDIPKSILVESDALKWKEGYSAKGRKELHYLLIDFFVKKMQYEYNITRETMKPSKDYCMQICVLQWQPVEQSTIYL